MRRRRYVPPVGKPRKTEAAYSHFINKYTYIHKELADRKIPPRTIGKPPKTEGA